MGGTRVHDWDWGSRRVGKDGVAVGASEPRQCLYFNKKILEEAGIDPETVYDLQAAGEWTWEAFEDMLKTIQKDTDNDGVVDIYGMTGSNVDMYRVAVFANGGKFFDFDDDPVPVAKSTRTVDTPVQGGDIRAQDVPPPAINPAGALTGDRASDATGMGATGMTGP